MKVIRPTTATQKGNPATHGYNAYDFSGKGEQEISAKYNGKVIKYSDGETRNWLAFSANDPYKNIRKGKLLTQDYGNYILVEYEGGLRHLIAHFAVNTVRKTAFVKGDILGIVGNTGNSTGKHSHHEYRQGNTNIVVDFIDDVIISPMSQYTEDVFNQSKGVLPDQSYNFTDPLDPSRFKDHLAVVKADKLEEERSFRSDRMKEIDNLQVEIKRLNTIIATPPITYTATTAPLSGDNFTAVVNTPVEVKPDLISQKLPTTNFSWLTNLWNKLWN